MPDSETSTLRRLRNTLGSNLSVFGTFHSLYGRRLYRNEREPNAVRFSIIINGIGKCMARGSAFYLYSVVAAAFLSLSRSLFFDLFLCLGTQFRIIIEAKNIPKERYNTFSFSRFVGNLYCRVLREMQPADRLAFGRFRHLAHHHTNNKKLLVMCVRVHSHVRMLWAECIGAETYANNFYSISFTIARATFAKNVTHAHRLNKNWMKTYSVRILCICVCVRACVRKREWVAGHHTALTAAENTGKYFN